MCGVVCLRFFWGKRMSANQDMLNATYNSNKNKFF